ncbi:hypothetical protein CLU79DRAFT_773436 [Phycomyces nitens]|nr:hypothetical protein CLU79DRAFT_773436 [Phycomyces nitens]
MTTSDLRLPGFEQPVGALGVQNVYLYNTRESPYPGHCIQPYSIPDTPSSTTSDYQSLPPTTTTTSTTTTTNTTTTNTTTNVAATPGQPCTYLNLPFEEQPCPKYREFYDAARPERTQMVDRLIDTAAEIIDSIWQPKFLIDQKKVKVIPTKGFIREMLSRSKATYSTLQICLFYLFRVKKVVHEKLKRRFTPPVKRADRSEDLMCCGRRMFLAALMLASKYLHDKNYKNHAWTKISGLSVSEINAAEMAFLKLIDYKLYVSKPTFDKWYTLLHSYTASRKI